MDRQEFVRSYGLRGHSTLFVSLVYIGVAFFVLPHSADVPDEWWQSLEIAYQQVYTKDLRGATIVEFPDGAMFKKEIAIPLENRTVGPSIVEVMQPQPVLPVSRQLAYGVRPWEWQQQNQLRSFSYPLFFYGVFSALKSVEAVLLSTERPSATFHSDDQKQKSDREVSSHSPLSVFAAQMLRGFSSNASGWMRTLFYVLPKLFCALVAVLLYKACCRFGSLVFEEILLTLPTAASAAHQRKKPQPADQVGKQVWSEDVKLLRESISPTTPEKFNKRVSIFVLTNFMVLYMSCRSLSNVPEALVFMWCLCIYASWRVGTLQRHAGPSHSSFATIKTAVLLLAIGGFGCTLRTTMAVPFAGVFFAFLLDIITSKASQGTGGRGGLVERLFTVIRVIMVAVVVTAMWLAAVLVLDSWYYCGAAPFETITALLSSPSTVATSLLSPFSGTGQPEQQCTVSFSPLNFYRFNFQQGSSSFFGSHPWWWYFALGAPACIGANIVILLIWVALRMSGQLTLSQRKEKVSNGEHFVAKQSLRLVANSPLLARLGHIIFTSMAVYSVLEHKEMRFVFPFISGPVMVACAVMYEEINNYFYERAIRVAEAKVGAVNSTTATAKPSDPKTADTATREKAPLKAAGDASTATNVKAPKTIIQRLALVCLLVNVVGLFIVGKTFKVGPPSVASYFRGNEFNTEKLMAARFSAVEHRPKLAATGGKASHLPTLHVWAGCYTMPGPSHFHHVFRNIRTVSCNTMATTNSLTRTQMGTVPTKDMSPDDILKLAKAASVPTRRLATEHELFLQFPLEFLNHTYGKRLAAAHQANGKSDEKSKSATSDYNKRQRKVSGESSKVSAKQRKAQSGGESSSVSNWLKSLQSKAAQDVSRSGSSEESSKVFKAKLQEALDAIKLAGQRLNDLKNTPVDELYGGLLGYPGSDEPLPDAIVMFSSLSQEIEETFLAPLGYTLVKQFFHTFAVVDEGTGHFIEVWMREE